MKTQALAAMKNEGTQPIRVEMNVQEEGLLDITLLDLQGNLLYNQSEFVKAGVVDFALPVERPSDRKCLLRVALNGKSELKKIIP